jgi:hypothetical protein
MSRFDKFVGTCFAMAALSLCFTFVAIGVAALQGLCANSSNGGDFDAFARDSVNHADALLEELAKEPQP